MVVEAVEVLLPEIVTLLLSPVDWGPSSVMELTTVAGVNEAQSPVVVEETVAELPEVDVPNDGDNDVSLELLVELPVENV